MTVLFLTLTIAHKRADSLEDLLNGLDSSWRALTRGGFWRRTKARHGVKHFIRVTEEQQGGEYGWHPHMHVLLFLRPTERYARFALQDALVGEWSRVVAAAGYRATAPAQLLIEPDENHLSKMSGYFTKQLADSMAWELTGQATKQTRGESRNPAQLLADAVAGDEEAVAAWRELEQATHGRRMIAWSNSCREELRLPPPVSAVEASQEPVPEPAEALVVIPRAAWEEHASRAGFREELAAAAVDVTEPELLLWWLHDRGIHAQLAPDRPSRVLEPPEVGPAGAEWLVSL